VTATTPLDAEELAAWRGFLRVHSAITKQLDGELVAEHGLTLSAYEVLLHLADSPGGCARMSDIAASVLLSRSGLTRLVDRLEHAGLVRREGVEGDARGSNAVITRAGADAFRRARRTHLAGVREQFLKPLSSADRRALARLWERILPGAV
jgi:DNA-binding MarR family transcriptional regulator